MEGQGADEAAARRAREEERRRRREERARSQAAGEGAAGEGAGEPQRSPGPGERLRGLAARSRGLATRPPARREPRPDGGRPSPGEGRLSEAWARRIAGGLLAVAAILAVLAIADIGPFADPPTEEEQAMAAVEGFFTAQGEGDWEGFCGRLTGTAREQVTVNASRLTGTEVPGCVEAVSMGGSEGTAGLELRIRDVRVIGNQARVDAVLKLPDDPPESRSVLLLEEQGEWLIDDPG